jgi:hypothetical protein
MGKHDSLKRTKAPRAAALVGDSEQRVQTPSRSVTFDIDDFPPQACEPVGAEATTPTTPC